MDYSNLYKKVKDSIVNIIQVDSNRSVVSTATGSIIGHGCDVLTCSHCIDLSLSNAIYDKSTNLVKCGTVIFDDEKLDIAILHFKDPIGTPLKIVKSDNLEIGNEIFTVGYPYTFPSEKTLTTGNIAAFENGLIKIDSSVNNGNSGGPLFNTNGEIVGVINAKLGKLSDFLEYPETNRADGFVTELSLAPGVILKAEFASGQLILEEEKLPITVREVGEKVLLIKTEESDVILIDVSRFLLYASVSGEFICGYVEV